MRRVLGVLLVAGVFVTTRAQAQSGAPNTEIAATVYLLRLERAQYLQSVCVLLDAKGHYHLERHVPRKVRVFEGSLDDDELRSVIHILSGDVLFNLQQKQIPDLMLKSDDDQVTLYIHRPASWQQLVFLDSASRAPFRDAMDPLMKWFEGLSKKKMRELSEEAGRNNCLPPSKPEFAQRREAQSQQPSTTASPATNAPSPPPNYTLQMFDNRLGSSNFQATCLLVSSTGTYHLVKQSKSFSNVLSSMVLDGTLPPQELASLRAILDAPDVVSEPDEEQKVETVFMGGSFRTRLIIPRSGKVQKIAAWRGYRIVNQVMTHSVEEHGTALLAPLREWLKTNIPDQSAVPTENPPNPRCSPGE